MPKQRKIVETWVTWDMDEYLKEHFYRYTKYNDDSIMGEPIDQETYMREKGN